VASSGPTPTGPCLSCAEGSRAGRRTPGGLSPEQSRGAESPHLTCWTHCFGCSPGYGWSSGLRVHIVGSCPAFHPPVLPSPSRQGCSQSLHPPACIDTGGCPNSGAGPLHLTLLNLMRFTWAHFSRLSRSLWMASHLSGVSTAPLSLVSSADLLRVHSVPLSRSLMKTLSSTHPSMDH